MDYAFFTAEIAEFAEKSPRSLRQIEGDMDSFRNLFFFVVMLGGLIAAHEAGHLLAAVGRRVKVKEFGIGLPPRLTKIGEWRGTAITLNWIPLGGFVRPEGEFDPSAPGGLAASPWQTRLLVFAAGPIANFIVGYLIFTFAFMAGWPDRVTVVGTLPGYPAEAAGLLSGDAILSASGKPLHYSKELTTIIYANLGRPIALEVEREGQILSMTMTPRAHIADGERPAGIETTNTLVSYPLPAAMKRALEQVLVQARETLALPYRLMARETKPEEVRLSGVVGLKQVSDRAVENSFKWNEAYPILHLAAVVSIALGITNLLPFPALDGGRILFVAIEVLRRKPVEARREKMAHAAGLVALLGLMIFLIVQDLLYPLF